MSLAYASGYHGLATGGFGLVVSDQSVGNVPCLRVGLPSNRTSTGLPFSRTTVV